LSFPRVSGARGIPEAKTRDPSRQSREGDKKETDKKGGTNVADWKTALLLQMGPHAALRWYA
jgi:hypothetical protein